MSRDMAIIAASRFALGASPEELVGMASDPRGWVIEQLEAREEPDIPSGFKLSEEQVAREFASRKIGETEARDAARRALREDYEAEAAWRTRLAARTGNPVRERLVRFWSNHFTVSVERGTVWSVAGAFEREAIRPHVTGRFADMLLAVTRHPAMLMYLDNAESIGPGSPAGIRRKRGLNENHGRELLELHTLGVEGGYTQDDVQAMAAILTGWGLDRESGEFRFHANQHEPGTKMLLSTAYAEAGEEEGRLALENLATHHATARHVAVKLARHYIADEPPEAAVAALTRGFIESNGDITHVMRLLVAREEIWSSPGAKLRSPDDIMAAALRSYPELGEVEDRQLVNTLRVLGQAPWAAPSPAGWPDDGYSWAGPQAIMLRLAWLRRAAGELAKRGATAERIAGLGEVTGRIMATSDNKAEILFLALASPEFQRR